MGSSVMINEDKFSLLRSRRIYEIKIETEYRANSNNSVEWTLHVRDWGVMMLEDLAFKEHCNVAIAG